VSHVKVKEKSARRQKPPPKVKVKEAVRNTAVLLLSKSQKVGLITIAVLVACCIYLSPRDAGMGIIAVCMIFYILFVGLKVATTIASGRKGLPALQPVSIDDPDLPIYTLLVPLRKELKVLKRLIRNINKIQYPRDKFQVLLLLDSDDLAMQTEVMGMELPSWFETVVTLDVAPQGKPKVLNMGFEQTKGAFFVIYDAEDKPDPDQLLKAVAVFRMSDEDVACAQARLYFFNEKTSFITRQYWAEYLIHFQNTLPGLTKMGLIPPLGGTSNHFKTEVVREIAIPRDQLPVGAEGIGGWDPWNVTEDAELAGALAVAGYKIVVFDSVTGEEASAKIRIADKQRRRWLKGFLWTGLMYLRQPMKHIRQMGFFRWFNYILLMIGTPLSLWLNPPFLGLTIFYGVARINGWTGAVNVIQGLFPGPLLSVGLILMVGGNAFLLAQLIVTCLSHEGYTTIKYLPLTILWWLFVSWSAYMVLWELSRKELRHRWNHTAEHGYEIDEEDVDGEADSITNTTERVLDRVLER
jgi:cellulose synthase/poly-beta-1,6-N-acetylglucosamine synthase-like glycosyltransferase